MVRARTTNNGIVAFRPISVCVSSSLSFAAPVNVAGKCGASVQSMSTAVVASASDDDTVLKDDI